MFLLVGLGNSGSQYENHRHNVGFKAVDAIASAASFSGFCKKNKTEIAEGHIGPFKTILAKPIAFMNLNGPPLVSLMMFYKIPPTHCIVFHDDLDLPLGKVRVKMGGGAGGHNGLRSLDQHIGNNYQRIRIGIDRPEQKEMVSSYVLSHFTTAENMIIEQRLKDIAQHIHNVLEGNAPLFMTRMSQVSA